ncbi:extracellular calcium-sensing receptor-like [Ambystoma mexicanum]|uniref:extracellular calcium-sensing receptor-like n=1 Tax=Ambystoma mexicanum TaxID=8296 RepID=UPI0037E8AE4C
MIRSSSAKVIVADTYEMDLKPLLQALYNLNVTDKIWILTSSISITPHYFPRSSWNLLNGSLALVLHAPDMPELKTFLESLHPSRYLEDIFIHSFWEAAFDCKWPTNGSSSIGVKQEAGDRTPQCTGTETMEDLETMFDFIQMRANARCLQIVRWDLIQLANDTEEGFKVIKVELRAPRLMTMQNRSLCITASLLGLVLATHQLCLNNDKAEILIVSLHTTLCNIDPAYKAFNIGGNLIQTSPIAKTLGIFLDVTLASHARSTPSPPLLPTLPNLLIQQAFLTKTNRLTIARAITGAKLDYCNALLQEHQSVLPYVQNVRFNTSSGEKLYFDKYGDVPPAFDYINIQIFSDGTDRLVKVGSYDSSAPEGEKIKMKAGVMMWNTGNTQVPRSFCTESCQPGFRQSPRKGEPNCCFDCVPCPAGDISNRTDSVDCSNCPDDYWPNKGRTQCDLTTLQFLSFEEPLGLTLACMAGLLFLVTLFVLWVFRRYQDTPIVKANNRGLSYLLLIALMLCFLSSFNFIGHPLRVTCMLRQNSFGIAFSISISTILAKTITVILAFDARDPSNRSSRWLGPRVAYGVVLACSLVPIIICTAWCLLDPPFPVKIQMRDTTILQCDEGSVLFFYLMLGYLGLLASVSFVVAFHARNLPQSFNEAKFLTFSMLVFLAVWISFIPAYLSTQGKYMVAVEIFAILSSGAGLLGCIFIPKCYIILWRPDMNTKQHLMQRPAFK